MEKRCVICEGTGFVKKNKTEFCVNNTNKVSSHYCYKCENIKSQLKSSWKLCDNCYGDGIIHQVKTTQEAPLYASS